MGHKMGRGLLRGGALSEVGNSFKNIVLYLSLMQTRHLKGPETFLSS